MKKLFAILMAVMLLASMATVVSAAQTTTLTTTVPAATYTLNIPADQEIPFGKTLTDIGNVTVTEASGFAEGKNLNVTVTYEKFTCPTTTTSIPFILHPNTEGGETKEKLLSGDTLVFKGNTNGTIKENASVALNPGVYWSMQNLHLKINSTDWGKALGGEYTATITFTAEVVAE